MGDLVPSNGEEGVLKTTSTPLMPCFCDAALDLTSGCQGGITEPEADQGC